MNEQPPVDNEHVAAGAERFSDEVIALNKGDEVRWHPVYGPYPDDTVDMGSSQCAPEPPFWVHHGRLLGKCWLHPTEARVVISTSYAIEIHVALCEEKLNP